MNDLPVADSDARRRATTELGTTFLVEAGAGTGKTSVLLRRVLTLLRTGRGQLHRIGAITFTEKAATELRVRLHRDIEAALAGPLRDDERRNLYSARTQLESAPISTIHAFCATLLRERPVEARVDPGFTILDEASAHLLRTEAWQEWLTQEMDRSPDVLKQALRAGLTLEHVQTVGEFLVEHRDCLHLLPEFLASPLPEYRAAMQEARTRLTALRTFCKNPADQALTAIQALATLLPASEDEHAWERMLLRDFPFHPRVGTQGNWQSPALHEVRAAFRRLAEHHTEARSTLMHNMVVALARWLTGFVRAYDAKKQERSGLDFTDLLIRTRDVLAHHLEVRQYFQRKFDYLLVDEFQDTDPLQVEITFFLAEHEPRAARWTAVTLRPGKLFAVGDPQQSIYRFRRADLAVYTQARQAIARQGEVVFLSSNFRSRAPLLNWLNDTFTRVLADAPTDQPVYRALTAVRTEDTGCEIVLLPVPAELMPAQAGRDVVRHAEARTVAALLKQIVTSPGSTVWGDRPIRYRDVAILFRTYQAMESYETALQHAGIPHRMVGGRRYTSRPEVAELRTLLRAVACPADTAALVATLRSSVFGFSDEELAQFVIAGGKWSYLSPQVPPRIPSAAHFTAAFALLRDLHARHPRCGPATLLYEVYTRTHLLPFFALRPHGSQRVANLLKLIDVAHGLAARGLSTLGAFNQSLQQHDALEEEPVLPEEQEDTVRLLTIHKAKGLEFPVVILADATGPLNSRSNRTGILDRLSGRLELSAGPRTLTCTTQGWQKAEAREQERDAAEEQRLRYVAAARARDHLIIPITPPRTGETGYTHWAFREGTDLESAHSSPADPQKGRPLLYRLSASTIAELEQHPAATPRFSHIASDVAAQHAHRAWEAERSAVLTQGRQGEAQRTVLRPCGNDLVMVGATRGAAATALLADERSAMPVFSRARAAPTCLTDVPFTLRHKDHLLEGQLDIAFLEDGAWVLVHVVADGTPDTPLEQQHHPPPSVLLSALACERLTGRPVKEVVLLCAASRQEVSVTWDEDTRARTALLLETMVSPSGGPE